MAYIFTSHIGSEKPSPLLVLDWINVLDTVCKEEVHALNGHVGCWLPIITWVEEFLNGLYATCE